MYDAIEDALKTIINPKINKANIITNSVLSNLVLFLILYHPNINISVNKKKVNSKYKVYFYLTLMNQFKNIIKRYIHK